MSTVPGEMTGTTVPATARRHPVLPATVVYGATAAVATHLLAAAIMIPALARQIRD
jgi:hypothetical protein